MNRIRYVAAVLSRNAGWIAASTFLISVIFYFVLDLLQWLPIFGPLLTALQLIIITGFMISVHVCTLAIMYILHVRINRWLDRLFGR